MAWPCQSHPQAEHLHCQIQFNFTNRKFHTWLPETGPSQTEDAPIVTFRKCCLWNTHFMLKLQPYSKDYCLSTSIPKYKIEVWNPKHVWSQEVWIRNIQPLFKSDSRRSLWTAVTQSRPVPAEGLWWLPLWNTTVIFIDMRVMFVGGQQYPKYVMYNVRRGSFGLIITHKTRLRRLFANCREIKWDSMWKAPKRVPVEIASSPSVGQLCLYRWLFN